MHGQVPLSEADVRALVKCEVLESLRDLLAGKLFPDRHMDLLRSRHILSEEDCEEINAPPTRKKKASKFLDILGKKGELAYDCLVASLKAEGTQTFLIQHLNEDFERRLHNFRELVGGQQNNHARCQLPITPPDIQPNPPPFPHRYPLQCSSPGDPLSQYSSPFSDSSCPSSSDSYSTPETASLREESGDGQKLSVTHYLQSLNVREEEGSLSGISNQAVVSSLDQSLSFNRLSGSSTDSSTSSAAASHNSVAPPSLDQPVFVSSASQSEAAATAGGRTQPANPVSLHVHNLQSHNGQGAKVDHPIVKQRLSSRGSPEDANHPTLLTELGGNNDPPKAPLALAQASSGPVELGGDRSQLGVPLPASTAWPRGPVEHEEREARRLKPVEHEDASSPVSFFASLADNSLAPSSPTTLELPSSSGALVLCPTALVDQKKALGKLEHDDDGDDAWKEKEKDKADFDVSLSSSSSVLKSLTRLAEAHDTPVKEIHFESPTSAARSLTLLRSPTHTPSAQNAGKSCSQKAHLHPESSTQAIHSESSKQGAIPGSSSQGALPGSITQGTLPGSSTQGTLLGSSTQEIVPLSSSQGTLLGSSTQEIVPGSSVQESLNESSTQGALSGSSTQETLPGSSTQETLPSSLQEKPLVSTVLKTPYESSTQGTISGLSPCAGAMSTSAEKETKCDDAGTRSVDKGQNGDPSEVSGDENIVRGTGVSEDDTIVKGTGVSEDVTIVKGTGEDSLQLTQGMSRERGPSTHNKDGHSLHSTHC